jgi:beta-lactamase class A
LIVGPQADVPNRRRTPNSEDGHRRRGRIADPANDGRGGKRTQLLETRGAKYGWFMLNMIARRQLVLGFGSGILSAASGTAWAGARGPFGALERSNGGRLGVFAVDVGSGHTIAYRADERFLMCSTFKLLVVAAVLSSVDADRQELSRQIAYGRDELVEPYPVTGPHVGEGSLSVEELCAAAATLSDSTAANLLLRSLGGPAALTSYLRTLGDAATRQDRYELSSNTADGDRDTTTPRAMALTTRKLLFGNALSAQSCNQVERWMIDAKPGLNRIRAGLPAGWRAGDRPGTNPTETNDVAVVWPGKGSPVIVAAYYDAPTVNGPTRENVLRSVGAVVAGWVA